MTTQRGQAGGEDRGKCLALSRGHLRELAGMHDDARRKLSVERPHAQPEPARLRRECKAHRQLVLRISSRTQPGPKVVCLSPERRLGLILHRVCTDRPDRVFVRPQIVFNRDATRRAEPVGNLLARRCAALVPVLHMLSMVPG